MAAKKPLVIGADGLREQLQSCDTLEGVTAGGTPGGSDTEINYNDGGTFAGVPGFTWNKTTYQLGLPQTLITNNGFSVTDGDGSNFTFGQGGGFQFSDSSGIGVFYNTSGDFVLSDYKFQVNANGNIGLGFNVGAMFLQAPTYNFSLGGYLAAATMGMEPRIDTLVGKALYFNGQDVKSTGATNKAGGDVYVRAGKGSGNATASKYVIQSPIPSTSGATLQALNDAITIQYPAVTITKNLIITGNLQTDFQSKGANYTVLTTDGDIRCTVSVTLTLYSASGLQGKRHWIYAAPGANVTFATSVNGAANRVLIGPQACMIESDGTNWLSSAQFYVWRDLLGAPMPKTTGATAPSLAVFRSSGAISVSTWQWGTNTELNIDYHLDHDYVLGTDIFYHVHWMQIVVDTGGAAGAPGVAEWNIDSTYAKGHQQAAFAVPKTLAWTQTASSTQYQHMIAEVQISNSGGDSTHWDRGLFEPDGLFITRCWRNAANAADTLNQNPFVPYIDLHYLSTGQGTPNKAPNFYT